MITFNKNSTQTVGINMAAVRRFSSPYLPLRSMGCPVNKMLDPCFSTSIYVHPICVTGQSVKSKKISENGFWMMQNPCDKIVTKRSLKNNLSEILEVYHCKPLISKNISSEKEFQKCTNLIAWTTWTKLNVMIISENYLKFSSTLINLAINALKSCIFYYTLSFNAIFEFQILRCF